MNPEIKHNDKIYVLLGPLLGPIKKTTYKNSCKWLIFW